MEDEVFEKVFERIELCGIELSLIAKVEIKQILEEIYQKAYDDCYEDFRTGKNFKGKSRPEVYMQNAKYTWEEDYLGQNTKRVTCLGKMIGYNRVKSMEGKPKNFWKINFVKGKIFGKIITTMFIPDEEGGDIENKVLSKLIAGDKVYVLEIQESAKNTIKLGRDKLNMLMVTGAIKIDVMQGVYKQIRGMIKNGR